MSAIHDWRPEGWHGRIQDYYGDRLMNAVNPYQGNHKRVLCVCSAGLLRSPTAALVLSQPPFNYNTRAAGVETSFALVGVDVVLLTWAQEIVCMTREHEKKLHALLAETKLDRKVTCLDIPDDFAYRDPELVRRIREAYEVAP